MSISSITSGILVSHTLTLTNVVHFLWRMHTKENMQDGRFGILLSGSNTHIKTSNYLLMRRFLGEWEEAVTTYKQAEVFAPVRNDHLVGLAQCYKHLKQYTNMLSVCEKLIDPKRTNPFPNSASFINNEHYVDTGTLPKRLYDEATQYVKSEAQTKLPFFINNRQVQQKRLFCVDNFYSNPTMH